MTQEARPTESLSYVDAGRLARGLCDLKAIRDARDYRSVADRLFLAAWSSLCAGLEAGSVAAAIVARSVAALRLGAIDEEVLAEAGLDAAGQRDVLTRAIAAASLPVGLQARLVPALTQALSDAKSPGIARALARQPRAGATAPDKPRVMLPEAETHGGHCLAVAVLGYLLADDDDRAFAFLAGLAHHLHNAALPDSGFAGEMLLGSHLEPMVSRLRERALGGLPPDLAALLRDALSVCRDDSHAAGRAFHAADVIDRVAQMGFHARAGAFRVEQATEELSLVHEGPLQAFHFRVLAEAAPQ